MNKMYSPRGTMMRARQFMLGAALGFLAFSVVVGLGLGLGLGL